ncbi:MAG: hypothetical protein R3E96_02835 [Planctomycetota bacterium]
MKASIWTRKAHRWAAPVVFLPFLLILVSGIALQFKKQWAWVQPPPSAVRRRTRDRLAPGPRYRRGRAGGAGAGLARHRSARTCSRGAA